MTSDTGSHHGPSTLSHVLVPIDGSELSRRALPTARALAERLGADVRSISVAKDADDAARLRTIGAAMLDVDAADERVSVVVGEDPADAIIRLADELRPSVVCMSTHGRGRLSGAIVGSVARSLLQRSPDPVIVLGPSADNPGWVPRPRRWPEPCRFLGSWPASMGPRPRSRSSPSRLRGPRRSICPSRSSPSPTNPPVRSTAPRAIAGYGPDEDADAYIDGLVGTWRDQVGDVDGVVERDPIGPASGLHHHLDERPAGLVALITNARSGMDRLLLGATAASLVHASVSPCLVAPVHA